MAERPEMSPVDLCCSNNMDRMRSEGLEARGPVYPG